MLDSLLHEGAWLRCQGQSFVPSQQESILLEKNGKASIRKRMKHFFITDRDSKGEVSVVWCPTGDMIGDYATKPLQGGSISEV
jgi:hypothetical protein